MEGKKYTTLFLQKDIKSKGQTAITVLLVKNEERYFIGQIVRKYDENTKKYTYRATNWEDRELFASINDLSTLKRKFKECGDTLLQLDKISPFFEKDEKYEELSRRNKLEKIREFNLIKERNKALQR